MNKYRKAFLEGRGHLKPAPAVVAAVLPEPTEPPEMTEEELDALTAPSEVSDGGNHLG